PQLHAVLVRPDAAHLGARIPRDHRAAPTVLLPISTPMSRRNCLPENATCSAAAYTLARSSPTRHITRPPAVTSCPLSARRVPAWKTRTSEGSASRPAIGSPRRGDSG